jgi:PEP-CTERM motif
MFDLDLMPIGTRRDAAWYGWIGVGRTPADAARATRSAWFLRWNLAGILLTLMLLSAGPALATTSFNGTPGTGGGGLAIETFVGAESFNLSSTETIRGVEFAGELFSAPGTLNWYIFNNNGFFPGSVLAQGQNPALSVTPFSQFISIVDFNLNTPVTLSAGTYWVGLNFPTQFVVWGETTTPGSQLSAGDPAPLGSGNWNLDAVQLYLGISETPLVAPEPGSVLLVGMGSIGLVWRRYRNRARALRQVE